MTLTIGWPELVVVSVAWVAVAFFRARAEAAGGMDVVPGSGTHQAPDVEVFEERGRVGFQAGRTRAEPGRPAALVTPPVS